MSAQQYVKEGLSGIQTILMVLVGVMLVGYLVMFWMDRQETADAKLVEATQISLQRALSQGVATLQVEPEEIHPKNIINAVRPHLPKNVELNDSYQLTIKDSKRHAQYGVTETGDLQVIALYNFTRYRLQDGRIVRSNNWLMPSPDEFSLSTKTH